MHDDTVRPEDGLRSRVLDGIRRRTASAAAKGVHAVDDRLGERVCNLARLDERRRRIARAVVREAVPETVGDRCASFAEGVALKAGIGTAGLLLRIPLKSVAAPILVGMAGLETIRAVSDMRRRTVEIADRIDAEMAAEAG